MNRPTLHNRTHFPVGLEEGSDGHVIVHAFTVPGCVGMGATTDEALAAFEVTLFDWLRFMAGIGEPVPRPGDELAVSVDEWIATGVPVAGGESDVLFEADRRPLEPEETRAGLLRLGALRGRLLPRVRRARNEDLAGRGDRNPGAILDELARSHWWLLTRLGASPLAEVPERIVARLDTAMALVVQGMTGLTPEARDRVIHLDGEAWTPRKVLRRLLWTEWTLGGAALAALEPADAESA